MKAAFLMEPGRIEVRDAPEPRPGPGEVVVKIRTALTCGTDLKTYRRGHPKMPTPTPFGHEFSGEIVAVGSGVTGFREGDTIMTVQTAPCGECFCCRRGRENLCPAAMDGMMLGAYAEYIQVPARVVEVNMFKKPDGLSFAEAAMLEPLACVVHGMRSVRFGRADTVLIIGAGPIGLLHVLLARAKGAGHIIVAGHHEFRLNIAREIGADYVVDSSRQSLIARARELTDGHGPTWVFECTGRPAVWEEAAQTVAVGGTVVLFGGCPTGTEVTSDTGRLHYGEITLAGAFHFTPRDVEKAYRLLAERRLNVRKLITGTQPLSNLEEVFEQLLLGECVKYAIVPDGLLGD
jgi:L-iditol 2-dehydrogenase